MTPSPAGALEACEPIPNDRTRRRLATRERLFEAAMAEFRATGVGAAQIELIVRRAGVARGTFYLHFPTKDDVLLEVLRRRQDEIAAAVAPAVAAPPQEFLRSAVTAILSAVTDAGPAIAREIFMLVLRRAAETEAETVDLLAAVGGCFAAAQDRGEVRGDLSPEDLVLLAKGIDDPDIGKRLDQAVDIFVGGIAHDNPLSRSSR
jgi:TetR/AcrR family transcriptional repressor of uid operon